MGTTRGKATFFSGETEENYANYIGEEPKVTDVNDKVQLLAYISYQNKKVEWLKELCRAKERRNVKLKEKIVRFAKMEEEHIPVKIDALDLEKIAYMQVRKRTDKESAMLDVLHIYQHSKVLNEIPVFAGTGFNDLHVDILVLLFTYEYLRLKELEKICKYRKTVGPLRLKSYYLVPLENRGLIKSIAVGPKSKYSSPTFIITGKGREKVIELAEFIMNEKLHPIKIYDKYYRKRELKNENTLWQDFGFPLRPIGKEEAPVDRRRRVRNREQV